MLNNKNTWSVAPAPGDSLAIQILENNGELHPPMLQGARRKRDAGISECPSRSEEITSFK